METTLFWIGCGLGAYAGVLRQFFKRESWLSRRVIVRLLHVLFMAAVGGLVGFVVSSSTELHGPTLRWPLSLGALAAIWGIIQVSVKPAGDGKEGAPQLLAADLEWAETAFSAFLLAAVIMYAVLQAFKIPSGSMEETLLIGDHLFVNKFIYGIRIPFSEKRIFKIRDVQRGDIIVFQCPDSALSEEDRERGIHKDFIKRAIGIPGDVVQLKNKQLFVNGQLQKEKYIIQRDPLVYPVPSLTLKPEEYQKEWQSGSFALPKRGYSVRDNFGPVKIPEGTYFVMGDNRDGSFDARFWGPMPNRLLKGKAWIVYWPLNRIRVIR